MYLGENTYRQGERPVYHCFLNRGMRLSAIVVMTCEGGIGVYKKVQKYPIQGRIYSNSMNTKINAHKVIVTI